jgi:hypothetical protein
MQGAADVFEHPALGKESIVVPEQALDPRTLPLARKTNAFLGNGG